MRIFTPQTDRRVPPGTIFVTGIGDARRVTLGGTTPWLRRVMRNAAGRLRWYWHALCWQECGALGKDDSGRVLTCARTQGHAGLHWARLPFTQGTVTLDDLQRSMNGMYRAVSDHMAAPSPLTALRPGGVGPRPPDEYVPLDLYGGQPCNARIGRSYRRPDVPLPPGLG